MSWGRWMHINPLFKIESFDHHTIYIGVNELPIGEVYKKDFFSIYSVGAISLEN